MNNLQLRILERAYARPGLTIGGLADAVSRGRRTEEEVRHLLEKGYLQKERGMELSAKGLACIDSASPRNWIMRIGKGALGVALSVVVVVLGNWIWSLIQSAA